MSLWQFLSELFEAEESTPPPLHLLRRVDAPSPQVTPPRDDEIDIELTAISKPFLMDNAHRSDSWARLIETLQADNDCLRRRLSELDAEFAQAQRCTPDFKL